MDIGKRLRDADERGVAPPQNWTTEAADLIEQLRAELAEVKQQRDELLKDAMRYRWLRDNKHLDIWWSMDGPADRCENINADIDAAMKGEQR